MTTMTIPGLTYRDAPAALDFRERAFPEGNAWFFGTYAPGTSG